MRVRARPRAQAATGTPYFVNQHFQHHYARDPRALAKLEAAVDEKNMAMLKDQCKQQQQLKQKRIEHARKSRAPDAAQLLQVGG